MLKKNKLLTGVVFPLMSFAIAVDPAFATSVAGAGASQYTAQQAVTHTSNAEMLLAQAEPPAEELPKKRQQEKQAEPEQPKAEQPKEEAPRPRREAAPEAAPEPKRQPEPKAESEQPRPRREAAPEGAAEPPKPRREAQPDAAPAQAQPEQQQERPRRPKPDQQPAAEGEQKPERPRRDAKPDAAAPDAAQPEQQQERPRRPKPDQPPAAEGQQKPAVEGERPRDPQAKPPAASETAPEKPATPGKKPAAPEPDAKAAPVPTEPPTPGKAPEPKEQPNPAPGQQPSEQQRPPRAQNGEQPPLPTAPKLENGAATGQAPAGEPVPQQVVTPQQEAPPTTKQELDRARAVAKDPSKSADTVILPVDKGAAVLDSDKEAERSGNQQSRDQRRQEREAVQDFKVPTSDAEAQSRRGEKNAPQINIQAITNIQGERINERPEYDRPDGVREWQPRDMPRGGPRDRDIGDRVFLQFGDRVVVRGNDDDRFIRDGAKPYYERLPDDRYRETVERPDGTQVVTVRNRYGDVIQRSRIDSRGREYVLFYAPELVDQPDREYVYRDPGLDLPPMRLRIPVDDYIIDTSSEPDRDYYRFLEQPPVEPVERVYTMDEVRYSARIRDKVRRIDLDTITFATGSAEIPMSQAQSLRKVADAISKVLKNNPAETFLIEGHTDAVGNDESNLVLSDERAASVANVMTDVYGIPPENLTTQGYGERFLKVQTLGPSQENRRVTIRRITSLVKPVAQN